MKINSKQTLRELDNIDWSLLDVPRSIVESLPIVTQQLIAGKKTDIIYYHVQIPESAEPIERAVMLLGRRRKDEKTGKWNLDPHVDVFEINEPTLFSIPSLKVVLCDASTYELDPKRDHNIIKYLRETRLVITNSCQFRQPVCNICPDPLIIDEKGQEKKYFVGIDSRSRRIVSIPAEELRKKLADLVGKCKKDYAPIGIDIKITNEMVQTLANGHICAALGKSIKTGKPYVTALSYNVARGEILEDYSAKGQQIRKAAYQTN